MGIEKGDFFFRLLIEYRQKNDGFVSKVSWIECGGVR